MSEKIYCPNTNDSLENVHRITIQSVKADQLSMMASGAQADRRLSIILWFYLSIYLSATAAVYQLQLLHWALGMQADRRLILWCCFYLSICLSVCPSIDLSVYLSIYLSATAVVYQLQLLHWAWWHQGCKLTDVPKPEIFLPAQLNVWKYKFPTLSEVGIWAWTILLWQKNQRDRTHSKNVSMSENTLAKYPNTRNYSKSMCSELKFQQKPDNLHPCGSVTKTQVCWLILHTLIIT